MSKGPLNYTTQVPAKRTIGECHDLLAQAGAAAVATIYEDRKPSGLSFQLQTARGAQNFLMPVRADAVATQLKRIDREGRWPDRMRGRPADVRKMLSAEHSRDVAWRVIKDWLEAQLAIITWEMVSLDEVMMPYLQIKPGVTIYQALSSGQAAITAGGES